MVVREAERVEQERGRALAEQTGAEQPQEDLRAAGHARARGRSREALATASRAIPAPSPMPQIQGAAPGRNGRGGSATRCDQDDERECAERERPHGFAAPLEGGEAAPSAKARKIAA